MASYRQAAAEHIPGSKKTLTSSIAEVQLDALVVLRIIKHDEDQRRSGSAEMAQGYLVGLVVPETQNAPARLEVTNCFPIPKWLNAEDDEDAMVQHQSEVLRKFRQINIDYLLAGFFQCTPFGACFTDTLVESAFNYQLECADSVILIYDSVKTSQGILSLKAYRLSDEGMKLCYKDFTLDSIKRAGISFSNLFDEMKVTIKNSHLVNISILELSLSKKAQPPKANFLDLASGGSLEKSLRHMMGAVDQLNSEMNKYNRYLYNKQKIEQQKENQMQRRAQENAQRAERGEPPLPDDDKYKTPMAPPMIESVLHAADINAHVDHALEIAGQNLGKLFMAEAVFEDRRERTVSS